MPFIPPDTKPSALIWVDGVVYTTTSGECGAAPNAVWAMDLNVAGQRTEDRVVENRLRENRRVVRPGVRH